MLGEGLSRRSFCRLWWPARPRLDAPEAQELPPLDEACNEVRRSRGALLRRRLQVTSQRLGWGRELHRV